MTFDKALKKFKKMVGDKYCTLRYESTLIHKAGGGGQTINISAYVEGCSWTKNYPNFKLVLQEMERQINPLGIKQDDNPKISAKE